jgi:hypothetical protein
MTDDSVDTDITMQVLNTSSERVGGDCKAVKNSDQTSFIYKIFTKIQFSHDDDITPEIIRSRFLGLSDAILKSTRGTSKSNYLATIDGKRIDPQSSPANSKEFQAYVNWTINKGRQSNASSTIMLHSAVRFPVLKRRIFGFLQETNIYITPNFTASSLEEIVRVALIPFMNPDLTFRKGFAKELNQKLQDIVDSKSDDFKNKYPCIIDDFQFDVLVSKTTERMTFQHAKISTTSILLVECPKSQSFLCCNILQEALTLMSPTIDGPTRYTAVPLAFKNSKQHPKGPATIFNFLKRHNQFLDEFKSFQIKGIHRSTMAILKPTIMTDCPAINAIEPTFLTDGVGKWTICTTKEKLQEAQDWMDDYLHLLMETTLPKDTETLPTLIHPQRLIIHDAISDLQFEHLVALSGSFPSKETPGSAWCIPPLTSPCSFQPTTVAPSTTMLSELATTVQSLEAKLISQQITIDQNESKTSALISAQTINLQRVLDKSIASLTFEFNQQAKTIAQLQYQVDDQASMIDSVLDCLGRLTTDLNAELAPLREAAQAGGLAALIEQTLLKCLPPSFSASRQQDKPSPVKVRRD